MDYERLSSEFLRALRGRRSQAAFVRKVKLKSNVAHSWETGRRFPDICETMRVARAVGLDVGTALRRLVPGLWHHGALSDEALVEVAIREVGAGYPIALLAERTGVAPSTLDRWLSGSTMPRLPHFFRFLDACRISPLFFASLFVDPRGMPSAVDRWGELCRRTSAAHDPVALAIMSALLLGSYRRLKRHRPGVLARAVGADPGVEEPALERLSTAGLIAWNGQRWEVVPAEPMVFPYEGDFIRRLVSMLGDRLHESGPGARKAVIMPASSQQVLHLSNRAAEFLRDTLAELTPDNADREHAVAVMAFVVPLAHV